MYILLFQEEYSDLHQIRNWFYIYSLSAHLHFSMDLKPVENRYQQAVVLVLS